MYQTVIILLVTAVVTIITTIVTVRVTMTGRVISQEAKHRLKAVGIRYGIALLNLVGLSLNSFNLIKMMRHTSPIDRVEILFIVLTIDFLIFAVFGLLFGIALAWFNLPHHLMAALRASRDK